MRGILLAALVVAGCTLETNTLDTTPGPQAGGSGGFDSGADASGGQAGNVATGGLAGSAGASGEAGAAGTAGQTTDAGSDVQTEAEADSGIDAASDGGTDAGEDSASDAAGEAEAGPCDWCESKPGGYGCYGVAECTDWCTGFPNWSKYASVGCWNATYLGPGVSCSAKPASALTWPPPQGKENLWYNGQFYICPFGTHPPECTFTSTWWNCPFTP